jgi:hypothetical protein
MFNPLKLSDCGRFVYGSVHGVRPVDEVSNPLTKVQELNCLIFDKHKWSKENVTELVDTLLEIIDERLLFIVNKITIGDKEYEYGINPRSNVAEIAGQVLFDKLKHKFYKEYKEGNFLVRLNYCTTLSQKENVVDGEIEEIQMDLKRYKNAYENGKNKDDLKPELLNFYYGYICEKRMGSPEFHSEINYEAVSQLAKGACGFLLENDLLELKEDLIKQVEDIAPVDEELFIKEKTKIAWMYELGVIDPIIKHCTIGGVVVANKAARMIEEFTQMNRDTVRKAIDALYNRNANNEKHLPLTGSEDELSLLNRKYKLDKN